jgi:hypothetical protein
MARRKSQGNIPLEWIGADVSVAPAGAISVTTFDLNLDDDEMAEILGIDSDIGFSGITADPDVATIHTSSLGLVMDPSYPVANDPYSEAVYEDLETFFTHAYNMVVQEGATDAHAVYAATNNKKMRFEAGFGIMLANNPAMLCAPDGAEATTDYTVNYNVRLYFKRRKATDMQLARTLLKRR